VPGCSAAELFSVREAAMSEAAEKVYKFIDDVTDPKIMTKEEYRDFLGELIDDLNGRLEAVVDELGEEA
jgi:polyhydroxyalkanoate synthesis regulator phasin